MDVIRHQYQYRAPDASSNVHREHPRLADPALPARLSDSSGKAKTEGRVRRSAYAYG